MILTKSPIFRHDPAAPTPGAALMTGFLCRFSPLSPALATAFTGKANFWKSIEPNCYPS